MQNTQSLTCISCPMGCRMTVTLEDKTVTAVEGNHCRRGDVYARQECVMPMRMVTAVVPVEGSPMPVSVKTAAPIPKAKIALCMEELRRTHVRVPVLAGDIVLRNVAQTGVDVVATKSIV